MKDYLKEIKRVEEEQEYNRKSYKRNMIALAILTTLVLAGLYVAYLNNERIFEKQRQERLRQNSLKPKPLYGQ